MGDLLVLLGAEAALALAHGLARRRGQRHLARECFAAGVALAVTVGVALLLTAVADDRADLMTRHRAAIGGALVVPGVLVGRLVAAWLRPRPPDAPRDEGLAGRRDQQHRH